MSCTDMYLEENDTAVEVQPNLIDPYKLNNTCYIIGLSHYFIIYI